jgi:hypothetical protein
MTLQDIKACVLLKSVNRLYYNDPPAVPPVVPPTVPPPPVVPPTVPPPPPGKIFTQEEVDKLMAEHRKGLQNQNKELIEQLEALRNNQSLTQQQRDELEARINTLSQQHLTKEQQTQEEYNKLKKKYETETKQLIEKENVWKNRFENTMIQNAISTGAIQHKALSATQLQMMFSSQGKVVEEIDDQGKPSGNWIAKMTVDVTDPKTKQKVKLELPISEAIGKLRENSDFANLFETDGRGGLGGNNYNGNSGGNNGNGADPTKMSTEEFMKWRATQGK